MTLIDACDANFLRYPRRIIELCQYQRHSASIFRMGKLQQARLRCAMRFIVDILWYKYRVKVFHDFRVSIWGKTPSTPAADNNSVAVPCHFPACSMYSATLQRYSGTAFSRCSSAVSSSSNSQMQFSSCRYSVRLSKSRPVRIMSAFLLVRLRCMTHVVSAAPIRPFEPEIWSKGQTQPVYADDESTECRCRTCLQGISAH